MAQAVVDEYTTSLGDLTFNSKPHINALTMLAEEYLQHAELIVRVIEAKLHKAPSSGKLPFMYLMDSIVKNVGGNYKPLFAKNIVKSFFSTFEKGDEKIKMSLFKLRSTWDNFFPLKKLYELDLAVHNVDQNWPVKPLPASLQDKPTTSIHVNPKFLKKTEPAVSGNTTTLAALQAPSVSSNDSVDLKQDLINKQKQLLELQQQKLLLELEQTKQEIAIREKRTFQTVKKQAATVLKDPRLKQVAPASVQPNLRVTLPNGQKQVPKDPRIVAPLKPKLKSGSNKAASDPLTKLNEAKQSSLESEKLKHALKKSPTGSEKAVKKKKLSPTSSSKQAVKSGKVLSPKNTNKYEPIKKTKVAKKKEEGKTSKRISDEKSEEPSKVEKERLEKAKLPQKDPPKRRERIARCSPVRDRRPPPVKQSRGSTSVESRRPPSPRRIVEAHHAQRPAAIRVQELNRDSPRSNDGSVSPRFSPEPEEGSPANWRPPIKRPRQQESQSEPWRPDDHVHGRGMPLARRRTSVDPNLMIPQELTLSHQAEILKQAEIQLHTGQLTHSQHQDMLKQLHQLFELQRLRNILHQNASEYQRLPYDHERPRMPLDEILPEHRDEGVRLAESDFRLKPSQQRHNENRSSAFRPPPSPPRMNVDRPKDFRPPPRARPLTPPPLPPTDSRMNRSMRPPHRDNPRFRGDHVNFQPRFNSDPGFRDGPDNMQRPLRQSGPPPPMMDRRPSPDRKRGAWNNPPEPMRPDVGEDMGNVFVLEEGNHFQPDPPHQRGPDSQREESVPDLLNGSKPPPDRVPLRAYAHPDQDIRTKALKRRNSSERRSPSTDLKEPKPKRRSPLTKEQSDNEDEGPHLEEPEDYIIANIPPGAEAYHEHSIKLKCGNSVAALAYQEHKKTILARSFSNDAPKEDVSEPAGKSLTVEDQVADATSSPDVSKKSNLEEEASKCPSLPLKKRKYLMSSSTEVRDSSDGGTTTEPELEVDAPKPETFVKEEEPELNPEPKKDTCLEVDTKDEKVEKVDLVEEVGKDDVTKQEGEKSRLKEELSDKSKNLTADKPAVSPSMESGESFGALKKQNKKKKNKRRTKERGPDGRMKRFHEPAMNEENHEKGRKGNQFPPRNRRAEEVDFARAEEERRLQSLMEQEQDILRWEAELEMQLGREEFLEMEERGRINMGSPPRRGWGRGDEGSWRGRGGPPARGRGWGRGDFWGGEPRFRGRPRPGERLLPPRRGAPMEDWDRPWDDRRPGPMRGPMPAHPDDRIHPRPGDRIMMDRPPRHGPPFGGSPTRPFPSFEPSLPPPQQPEMNQVNVNKLLGDLLSMGIIPGSAKPAVAESPPNAVATAKSDAPVVSSASTTASDKPIPISMSQEELSSLPKATLSLDSNRVPTPVFEDLLTMDPDSKLPDIRLDDMEELKIRHEEVVKRLYTGIQCSACGMRFTACQTDMYAEHLDWHYRLNRKDKDGVRETHRILYPTAGEWIMYEEIVDPSQRVRSQIFDEGEEEPEEMDVNGVEDSEDMVVPVAQNPEQDKCAVCNDAFKTVYNDEEEEWQYVNCVAVDGKNFHPSCYTDHNDDSGPLPTPTRVPLYNPVDTSIKGIPGLDSLMKDELGADEDGEGQNEETMGEAPASPENNEKSEPESGEGVASPMETEEPLDQGSEVEPALSVSEPTKSYENDPVAMPSVQSEQTDSQDVDQPQDLVSTVPKQVDGTGPSEYDVQVIQDVTSRPDEPTTAEYAGTSVAAPDIVVQVKIEGEDALDTGCAEPADNDSVQSFVANDDSKQRSADEGLVENFKAVSHSEDVVLARGSAIEHDRIFKNEAVSPATSDRGASPGVATSNHKEFENECSPPECVTALSSADEPTPAEGIVAFSIPTVVSSATREVEPFGVKRAQPAFGAGPEFEGSADEPLPPGTEPALESGIASGSESDDGVSVTL